MIFERKLHVVPHIILLLDEFGTNLSQNIAPAAGSSLLSFVCFHFFFAFKYVLESVIMFKENPHIDH
jgi:hypothetical protein